MGNDGVFYEISNKDIMKELKDQREEIQGLKTAVKICTALNALEGALLVGIISHAFTFLK